MIAALRAGIVGAVLLTVLTLVLNPRSGSNPATEVSFGPLLPPTVIGDPASFGAGAPAAGFELGQGWHAPEAEFVWSDGPESTIRFRFPERVEAENLTLVLSVLGFSPGLPDLGRTTRFMLETDSYVTSLTATVGPSLTVVVLPLPFGAAKGLATIRIFHGDPLRPCDVATSDDCRSLSIRLYEAELRRADG